MIVLIQTLKIKYTPFTFILEFIYNKLQAKSSFKKEAQKTAIKDIKNVLKVEHKVIVNQLKTKFQ